MAFLLEARSVALEIAEHLFSAWWLVFADCQSTVDQMKGSETARRQVGGSMPHLALFCFSVTFLLRIVGNLLSSVAVVASLLAFRAAFLNCSFAFVLSFFKSTFDFFLSSIQFHLLKGRKFVVLNYKNGN